MRDLQRWAKNRLVHCSKTATLFNRFAGGGLDAEPGVAWVLRALYLSVARDFLPSLIHEIRVASIHYPGGSPANWQFNMED
jgi:hypothetical protein